MTERLSVIVEWSNSLDTKKRHSAAAAAAVFVIVELFRMLYEAVEHRKGTPTTEIKVKFNDIEISAFTWGESKSNETFILHLLSV